MTKRKPNPHRGRTLPDEMLASLKAESEKLNLPDSAVLQRLMDEVMELPLKISKKMEKAARSTKGSNPVDGLAGALLIAHQWIHEYSTDKGAIKPLHDALVVGILNCMKTKVYGELHESGIDGIKT
jgi:hypothetical protein